MRLMPVKGYRYPAGRMIFVVEFTKVTEIISSRASATPQGGMGFVMRACLTDGGIKENFSGLSLVSADPRG